MNCSPEKIVREIIYRPRTENWKSSGTTKEFYLDLVESIVRHAEPWVDEKGAVIDPVLKAEWHQTSPRFAAPCAVLIQHGRCLEFKEKLYTVMDYCCKGLNQPDSVRRSPDFWMRELVTAWLCLKDISPADRVEMWRSELAKVIPEKNYTSASSDPEKLKQYHNWAVFGSAGESMRDIAGIGGPADALWGNRFFDNTISYQLMRFNEFGMYRDPNDPFTYDITTRHQIETAIFYGYRGKLYPVLRELLDKAMFLTLLLPAPSGEVPFGGRSSQFYFQEAIISALCELAASRYKEKDPLLAGAFKRQAHLSIQAVRPGFLRTDGKLFHLKNNFPHDTRHGCDSYGHYSVYSLVCASIIALAALYADDSIEESPAPSETGGYNFALTNSFYKAFSNCSGNYLQFDLKPTRRHDACGLGRILLEGLPWGLLPVQPFPYRPGFVISPEFRKNTHGSAVAPEWKNRQYNTVRLADNHDAKGSFREIAPGISETTYLYQGVKVIYTADISHPGSLELQIELKGDVTAPEMVIPVLQNDGANRPELQLSGSNFTAKMKGVTLHLDSDGGDARISGSAVNRTGIYTLVKIPMNGCKIKLLLKSC